MPRHTLLQTLLTCTLAFVLLPAAGCRAQPATQPAGGPPAPTPPPAAPQGPLEAAATQAATGELPHLTIDREAGVVEVESRVVLRDGEWLELLLCTPGTREHESILASAVQPSHLHLALLLAGAEPGQPFLGRMIDGEFQSTPPRGQPIRVSVRYEQDGEQITRPANEWVLNRVEDGPLQGDRWLFTGSQLHEHRGERLYMADLNGTIISLVNFGDDVLARDTSLTDRSDDQALDAITDEIPELGTPVTVILEVVSEDQPEASP
jgi:hypothetical protein